MKYGFNPHEVTVIIRDQEDALASVTDLNEELERLIRRQKMVTAAKWAVGIAGVLFTAKWIHDHTTDPKV